MQKLEIVIASDVMCPWCAIGYKNLDQALHQLAAEIDATIEFKPFELNPDMPAEGQNLREHLVAKYALTDEQSQANRQTIQERGREADFTFNFDEQSRMYNSFDCHRLLTWALAFDKQIDLKMALLTAYFTDNKPLNERNVLLDIVASVGLDSTAAEQVLASEAYVAEVRQEQAELHKMGIHSVPTFIINQQYAISGGQPVDVFKQALQQICSEQGN